MTDQTTNALGRSHAKPSQAEFRVYFAIIFAATLPLATLTWALALLKGGRLPDKGPMARAWTQARIITPAIFSA